MKQKRLTIPLKEFTRYIREHSMLGLAAAFLVVLVYARQAFSTNFYLDEEVYLTQPHSMYNWGQIGRFGLIALKYLAGNSWYNPYLEAVLFLAALWALGMCFSCFFSRFCPKCGDIAGFISIALFLVFPTYAEQFMFRVQSFEVALAMLLTVLAARYFYLAAVEGDYWGYGLAALLEIFSFGIYQSMVNLQICLYIAIWLFTIEENKKTERKKLLCREIIHFLLCLAIYGIIVKLFFDSGDYLGVQMGWRSGSPMSAVMNLLAYIKRILLAMDVFYPISYPVCVCACIALLIWAVLRSRQLFWPYIVGLGSMLASPFFLSLATGTPSPYRAQLMLPFVCAVLWLFFASRLRERGEIPYTAGILVGCVFLLCQASPLMRLFYTQDIIRNADSVTAAQIMARLQEADCQEQDKPVVFIGHLDAKINGSCYTKKQAASYLSYSVYESTFMDGVPVDTPDYFNTGRILGYFETLGFHYAEPSLEMVEEAKAAGVDMACWPSEDSVKETQEYIIVKLSD